MGSQDAARTRELNKEGVLTHLKDDESVAIRLRYIGSGTVSDVNVDASTNFEMVSSDGGTDTIVFGAGAGQANNVGELVDLINGLGIFEAKVLDCLRSESADDSFVDGTINSYVLDGVTVWDVLVTTDATDTAVVCATPDRGFSMGAALSGKKVVRLKKAFYNQNVSAAEPSAVKIIKRKGSAETVVASWTSVDATDTTVFDYTASDFAITARRGEELLFSVEDATSITDAAANFIEVSYEVL